MRWSAICLSAAALIASVSAQDDIETFDYCDAKSRCFNAYEVSDIGITYGVAVPVTDAEKFDVILQTTAPLKAGWAGFAWGGGMTYNPLAIMWQNGNDVMISSRMAFGYFTPPKFADTTYTVIDKSVNATHWSITALCKGCSYWAPFGADPTSLNPKGENYFAFAFSSTKVDDPANIETTFGIHERVGHWIQDLADAATEDFAKWAPKAGESPTPAEPAPTTELTPPSTPEPSPAKPQEPEVPEDGEPASSPVQITLPESCPGVAAARFPIQAADGWKVVKLAQGLTTPRDIVVDKKNNLLVIENGKGLSAHTFGSNGCIASSKLIINNGQLNHGLDMAPDGETIYVSSQTTVWRYKYDDETQTVSDETIVIKNMWRGGHPTRALTVPPQTPNLLVVQLGSNANFDMESIKSETARAIVKVFDVGSAPEGGWDYIKEGWNLGYGLRNEVALVPDGNNMIWGIENSGDNLGRTAEGRTVDVHIDNPAEELNFLGDPSKPNNDWYGYPVCFTIGEPKVFVDKTFKVGDQFVVSPNTTYTDDNCVKEAIPPRLAIQAHSAPIDGVFDKTYENLYVTLHGSWNRSPPTGYKVIKIPFTKNAKGGYEPVAAPDAHWGYEDIITSVGIERCSGSACIRPSGIAFDRGFTRFYFASDNTIAGELFVVYQAK